MGFFSRSKSFFSSPRPEPEQTPEVLEEERAHDASTEVPASEGSEAPAQLGQEQEVLRSEEKTQEEVPSAEAELQETGLEEVQPSEDLPVTDAHLSEEKEASEASPADEVSAQKKEQKADQTADQDEECLEEKSKFSPLSVEPSGHEISDEKDLPARSVISETAEAFSDNMPSEGEPEATEIDAQAPSLQVDVASLEGYGADYETEIALKAGVAESAEERPEQRMPLAEPEEGVEEGLTQGAEEHEEQIASRSPRPLPESGQEEAGFTFELIEGEEASRETERESEEVSTQETGRELEEPCAPLADKEEKGIGESALPSAETDAPEQGPEEHEHKEQLIEHGPANMKESLSPEEQQMILALRAAEPRLSSWLAIVLEGVEEAGDLLFSRLRFLLRSLEAPDDEVERFVADFRAWLEDMEYTYLEEFRSELQYRLALALELEDEEDERSRLLIKISQGLSKTREHLSRKLDALLASHGELDDSFYDHLEEVFITADMGYEASLSLVARLKERARVQNVRQASEIKRLLKEELEEVFRIPAHITAYTAPEVVLMVGVNGVGKTTTIGKLAHRARLQGRKVMICAADTFRAAAIEQLQVWAERAGALFYAKKQGSDPAAVAYEAMDRAVSEGVDLLFVDTAGRLQTKTNLMEELSKIRNVLGKKHPGSPHRTVLVIDATTGQNALSQVKLFKESSGVDELILTKLDGTAKGGFAIALALQFHLPISFIGLGEKLEDLRPFSGDDFADALIEERTPSSAS